MENREEKYNPFENEEVKNEATEPKNVLEPERKPAENPVAETLEPIKDEPKDPNRKIKTLAIIALIGAVLGFLSPIIWKVVEKSVSKDKNGTEKPVALPPMSDKITIAYINTDTLMENYAYAKEVQRKMEQLTAQQSSLAQQEAQFQQDYQNYLQTGENLTLSQQQEKEKELKARYEKLQRLEKQFTDLLPQRQKSLQDELDKMTKAVYNFIADYNAKHDRYTFILSKSYSSSPVLYGDPAYDITNEILEGLNAEYELVTKNKEKEVE